MGIRTIAVYSDADRGALHTRACDASVRIGPPPARDSYLRIDAIVAAAKREGAQAVHPGYGFLAENPAFAQACAAAGLVFVGPPAAAMHAMGDKIEAKKTVQSAGVPTVPGYLGAEQSPRALREQAQRIGLPVLIKAAAGGGGKGMRVLSDFAGFEETLRSAKREALGAFGDDRVLLERYLQAPRHIEIQILADAGGGCIYLGERECSIQRRHQKVLEEAPSFAVSARLRAEMGEAAVRAAQAVGYVNAGTVEFMLDADGRYYFLEMNARLQVEHPVTEALTGLDLVAEQLWIAAGRPLRLQQAEVRRQGHAIEVRVYAENPQQGFLPSTGRITHWHLPAGPGVRNDVGVAVGSEVTADYDPLLAKLVVHGHSRKACIERLAGALDEYAVGGVVTNIGFLRWLVSDEAFRNGATTTAFLEQRFDPRQLVSAQGEKLALIAAAAVLQDMPGDGRDPWQRLGGWRPAYQARQVRFSSPRDAVVEVSPVADATGWRCESDGTSALVKRDAQANYTIESAGHEQRLSAEPCAGGANVALGFGYYELRLAPPPSVAETAGTRRKLEPGTAGNVKAPMSGKVSEVRAAAGERVHGQQVLVTMEAMKMEHAISAPYAGIVQAVSVAAGQSVAAGDVLMTLEPAT
jgi:3-methylcrotonyl-CoA carboxylase alpha subunit